MTLKGRFSISLIFLFTLSVIVGCGPGSDAPATLEGKVTYKGAPVTGGTMIFYPTSGEGQYTANLRSDGTYRIADIPPGEMKVTVDTLSLKRQQSAPDYSKAMGKKGQMMSPIPEGANTGSDLKYVQIPRKYSSKESSDLSVTLEGGGQQKDFELTD